MFRATLDRLQDLEAATPLVVANITHAELVAAELSDAGFAPGRVILEPFGRNTAPAAAAAALELTKGGEDPLMLLLPADHVIEDVSAFVSAARYAAGLASSGRLVTFGIVPTHPETGYGYIRVGGPIDEIASTVAEFVEKPNLETARDYLSSGEYLWNSGMFVFRCSDYLAALDEFAPVMLKGCRKAVTAGGDDGNGLYLDPAAFEATPADSIDYAVMEHTANAAVVPLDAGWNDVGSWAALWDVSAKDADGNVTVGDVMTVAAQGSYVSAESRLVTVAGVDNIVVVETADAVLVTSLENAQQVKDVVEKLKEENRSEATRRT